jgi:hypothetical protein
LHEFTFFKSANTRVTILTHLGRSLFLVHFHEAILYIAILAMLFLHGRSASLHDRDLGLSRVAGTCVRLGHIQRQRATDVPANKLRAKYQLCSTGCFVYGIDLCFDDRLMWPTLDEGIFGIE